MPRKTLQFWQNPKIPVCSPCCKVLQCREAQYKDILIVLTTAKNLTEPLVQTPSYSNKCRWTSSQKYLRAVVKSGRNIAPSEKFRQLGNNFCLSFVIIPLAATFFFTWMALTFCISSLSSCSWDQIFCLHEVTALTFQLLPQLQACKTRQAISFTFIIKTAWN